MKNASRTRAVSLSTKPLAPDDDLAGSDDNVRIKPGESHTFHATGKEGDHVTIALERVPDSGGHFHGGATRNSLAVGAISPNDFTLGPDPQEVVYKAPEVCGVIRVIVTASESSDLQLVEVMYDSFLPIPQSTGIALKTPEAIHPSPYWADVTFITKLKALGERFYAKFHKDILITDASLAWGGRFDIKAGEGAEWQPPHVEHRNGHQADVRLWSMSEIEKTAFQQMCTELQIQTEVHAPPHWHLRG
jgi:hypothetical protein